MKKSKLLALAALASLGVNANAANEITSGEKYYIQNVESGKYISAGAYWGTRSVLADQGVDFTVNIADGKYTLVSGVKGQNTALRPSDGFMDQSGTWEVISNGDGTFKIKGSEGYLKYDGTDFPNVKGVDADSGTDWKFLTNADREALLTGASASNPKDATFYIQAPDFVDGDYRITGTKVWGNVVTGTGGNYNNNCTLVNSSNGEMYNKANGSKLIQTLTGIKNGKYKVSCLAFYRAGNSATAAAGYDKENDKDGNQFAWFFANDEKVAVKSVFHGAPNAKNGGYTTAGGDFYIPNNQGEAAACFSADNNYLNEIEVVVTDGTLSIGIEKTGNVDADWVLFDNFRLTYLGEVTDLSAYKSGFETAYAAAYNIDQNKAMNSIVLKTLTDALENYSSDFSTYSDKEAIANARTAWTNAANAAANSIAAYADIAAKLATLDAAGQANFKDSEVGKAYVAKTYVDADCTEAFAAAAKAQTTDGADMTLAITNNSFENDFASWTNDQMAIQTNTSFGKDGNKYVEFWQPSAAVGVKKTIKDLPAGQYKLTLRAKARGVKSATLYAGSSETSITIADEEKDYDVTTMIDAGSLEIGFKGEGNGTGASWFAIDNFRLTYVSSEFPALTAVTGTMNSDKATAQTNALNAYNNNKTVANYNAAAEAIAAAQSSKDHFASVNSALLAQKALIDGTNVYDATGFNAYKDAYDTNKGKYDNLTLDGTEDVVNPSSATAWHASTAYNFLLTPWKIGGEDCNNFDKSLYINTWSTEGNNDGSNFTVPFFEYWVADANSLGANTISSSVSELPNGLYKVEVWTRVRAKNGVTATDATGITLKVNDGTAVDATNGAQIGTSQFTIATVEAQGLVKDGNLNITLDVVDGNNISWLSFKNVKYTKVRDLTDAEKAVAPTALTINGAPTPALKPGETATLTVTYTPADATEGITWTSSDETIAKVNNGVVTAVGEGTATITATSTIATTINATATISVAYPTELANANFGGTPLGDVDIKTYSKDGTPSQMQPVDGWQFGVANGDARAAAVVAYGSATTIAGANFKVPTTGPEGTNGQALAMVGVWTGTVQYVQTVSLPADKYALEVPVYNQSGTAALSSNLIGVKYGETTKYASTKNYVVGQWTTEFIEFELTEKTPVQISLGIVSGNNGSSSVQHLFVDRVTILTEQDIEDRKAAAAAAELAAAKVAKKAEIEALTLSPEGEGLFQYSSTAKSDALALVDAATDKATVNSISVKVNAPASDKAFMLSSAEGVYLNVANANQSATQSKVFFTQNADGSFKIGNDNGEYVHYKGGDSWSMDASATGDNFTVIAVDGGITIKGKNGYLGLDGAADGEDFYGNKGATTWAIAEYVAPAPATPSIEIADKTELPNDATVGTTYKMSYKRTIKNAKYQGLYVPYSITGAAADNADVTMYEIRDISVSSSTVSLKVVQIKGEVNSSANTPLMFKVNNWTANTDVTIANEAVLEEANENEQSSSNSVVKGAVKNTFDLYAEGYYALSGGDLCQVSKSVNLPLYRWAVKFPTVPAGARLVINITGVEDEDATAIASAIAEQLNTKVYTINGVEVDGSNLKPGMYIKNGKKILVK